MNEEESKAIYRLNFHIKGADEIAVVNKADVETVLNMIEEKNEEIERSEVEYHDLAGEIYRLETELEKKDKEIKELELFEKMSAEIISNSILKQKIQDKIDEINKAYEDSKNERGETEFYYPNYTIEILQELLEDKESEIQR